MKDKKLDTKIFYNPDDHAISEAAQIIRSGGLVAFPTETVYGLGANALNGDAAAKIFAAKGRPSDNPLIIHLADSEDASEYALVSSAYKKLTQFMPGPLTVILPKREIIPDSVTGGLDTVAIRVPLHSIARALIKEAGVPIAAPSANLSGKPSCTKVEHVIYDMSGRIDAILDGGDSDFGLESTIVMPIGDDEIKLLRPGAVTVEMLVDAGFKVSLDKAVTEKLAEDDIPLAPGMKYRHYAPEARVILLSGDKSRVDAFMVKNKHDPKAAFIVYEEDAFLIKDSVFVVISKRDDTAAYAHNLFSVLRELDGLDKVETIYAPLPKADHIGLALYNRLMKAAGYSILNV